MCIYTSVNVYVPIRALYMYSFLYTLLKNVNYYIKTNRLNKHIMYMYELYCSLYSCRKCVADLMIEHCTMFFYNNSRKLYGYLQVGRKGVKKGKLSRQTPWHFESVTLFLATCATSPPSVRSFQPASLIRYILMLCLHL